jgi:pimeloyl-ACP methyl ester carboxylesterase
MTDRDAEVRGARIRYRREGDGPPIVLVHGLGASLESWDLTVPALTGRYTTIRFDFPGFGLSDPMPGAYTPDGAAEAVHAILDALGVERTALIGTSLGGAIAALAACRAPERFASLVLIAPAGFDREVGRAVRLLAVPALGEVLLAYLRYRPRLSVVGTFADPSRMPDWVVEVARRNLARGVVRRSVVRVLREALGRGGVRPDVIQTIRDGAARIAAPTLIVWGTADRVIPFEQAQVVATVIPGARLRVLPGLGHVPYLEEPATFNTVLTEFLAAAAGRPTEARR